MSASTLASSLRSSFLDRPFGVVRLWGFAAVRPNDQAWRLVAVHEEGDRLELTYVHESRSGRAAILSLWGAAGLEPAPAAMGQGIAVRSATRVQFEGVEAHVEGGALHLKTPRGEGVLPLSDEPALVLCT